MKKLNKLEVKKKSVKKDEYNIMKLSYVLREVREILLYNKILEYKNGAFKKKKGSIGNLKYDA